MGSLCSKHPKELVWQQVRPYLLSSPQLFLTRDVPRAGVPDQCFQNPDIPTKVD